MQTASPQTRHDGATEMLIEALEDTLCVCFMFVTSLCFLLIPPVRQTNQYIVTFLLNQASLITFDLKISFIHVHCWIGASADCILQIKSL